MSPQRSAHLISLLVPLALMLGALISQYWGGLIPCEMCWWQRYPHIVAIILALLAFLTPAGILRRVLIAAAAGGTLTSGLIGVFHAGVEYHWWEGITSCATTTGNHNLSEIMAAPLVRCDTAQWSLFGISLAGYNALISIPAAIVAFLLLGARKA